MRFEPAVTPPSEPGGPSWWFVFQDDKLLVKLVNGTATLPCIDDLSQLHLQGVRRQYLGQLDGIACRSAELSNGAAPPEGMSFVGLRKLYGLLEEEMFALAGRAVQIVNWDQTHQYCGRCGAPTETHEKERSKVCPRCGLMSFPRISPAVIVAVVREGQILLAHANHFPSDFYSVLAGFVEPGETLEECVMREVREEVGIEVKNIRYFGSQSWPFPHSLMVGFTAEYAGGELTPDRVEIGEAGWFSADNLPRIPDKISIARRLIDWFNETYG